MGGTTCSVCHKYREGFFSFAEKPTCPDCFDKVINKLKRKKEDELEERKQKLARGEQL